jgi:polyribonucleotide nucleotidyltransferase
MRVKTGLGRVREWVAMKRSLSVVLLLGTLLGACGESDEEQAQDAVNAIRDDLEQIAEAQGDLNDERKQELESANKEFKSQFQSIAKELSTSLSVSGAKEQFQAAVKQLAGAYRQSFAGVDCS